MVSPFVKWAGGKRQLLPELANRIPLEFGDTINRYAEPFIGGGAFFFYLMSRYNIKEAYIGDMNTSLITTYQTIRDHTDELIAAVTSLENQYNNLQHIEAKKEFYLLMRERYNAITIQDNQDEIEVSLLFLFLNKAGFNGMYRVNRAGRFNVPFGSRENLNLVDRENLPEISRLLQSTTIVNGPYQDCEDWLNDATLVYLDPPYRPLSTSASFNSYTNNGFGDTEQEELSDFIKRQTQKKVSVLVSNSDPHNTDPEDNFFDDLYNQWGTVERIQARRSINSVGSKRGNVSEILAHNF